MKIGDMNVNYWNVARHESGDWSVSQYAQGLHSNLDSVKYAVVFSTDKGWQVTQRGLTLKDSKGQPSPFYLSTPALNENYLLTKAALMDTFYYAEVKTRGDNGQYASLADLDKLQSIAGSGGIYYFLSSPVDTARSLNGFPVGFSARPFTPLTGVEFTTPAGMLLTTQPVADILPHTNFYTVSWPIGQYSATMTKYDYWNQPDGYYDFYFKTQSGDSITFDNGAARRDTFSVTGNAASAGRIDTLFIERSYLDGTLRRDSIEITVQ
jgi:hypothetical protein